jgi:hypothetical protein
VHVVAERLPRPLLFYVNDPNTADNQYGWQFDVLIYKA